MDRPTVRSTGVILRRCFWKYRVAFGFLCLATGIMLAVILLQNETEQRISADRKANEALRSEIDERAAERKEIDEEFAEQLARLERVNRTQNAIIRALLTLRKNDPDLFEGVNLPTVAEFEEQLGKGGSARPDGTRSQRPTTRNPRPDNPGPTPRNPNPTTPTPTAPTPTTPTPVAPTPTQPVGPVSPPTQPPTGPVVDPVVEVVTCPLIGVCLPSLGL